MNFVTSSPPLSIARLIYLVSYELSGAVNSCRSLQETCGRLIEEGSRDQKNPAPVTNLIATGGFNKALPIQDLQRLDILTQILEDLCFFLQKVGNAAQKSQDQEQQIFAAVKEIKLHSLRERLHNQLQNPSLRQVENFNTIITSPVDERTEIF